MSATEAPALPDSRPAPAVFQDDIVELALNSLRPHPQNTRGKIPKEDVAELAASIKVCDLIHPLLVTPADAEETIFSVIAGHRRLEALKLNGAETARCRIVRGEHAALLTIMIVDNEHRASTDPLREAEVVSTLLHERGMSPRDVAEMLSKPVRWVARRANLSTLSPAVRKAEKAGKLEGWTLAMFEDLAQLTPSDQDALMAEAAKSPWMVRSEEDLAHHVAERLHVIGKAKWSPDDALLVPKAGACSTCKKHSLHTPGLFDDGLDDQDVTKATCRDGACWISKQQAWLQRDLAAKRAENPDLVLLRGEGSRSSDHAWLGKEADNLVGTYDVVVSKKGAPGAKLALVVSGEGVGTTKYVQLGSHAKSAAKKASKAKGGKDAAMGPTMAERRQGLQARRNALVVDKVLELVRDAKAPRAEAVRGLAAAFGMHEHSACEVKTRIEVLEASVKGEAWWGSYVWDRVRPYIEQSLKRFGSLEDVPRYYAMATWLCQVLQLNLEAIETEVAAELTEPKSWAALERAEGNAKPKPERKAGRPKRGPKVAPKAKAKGKRKRAAA